MAEYQLEYGSDKIEMHIGAIKEGQRVLLLDDLIATGGTLAAGIELMKKVERRCFDAAVCSSAWSNKLCRCLLGPSASSLCCQQHKSMIWC